MNTSSPSILYPILHKSPSLVALSTNFPDTLHSILHKSLSPSFEFNFGVFSSLLSSFKLLPLDVWSSYPSPACFHLPVVFFPSFLPLARPQLKEVSLVCVARVAIIKAVCYCAGDEWVGPLCSQLYGNAASTCSPAQYKGEKELPLAQDGASATMCTHFSSKETR